MEEIKLTEEAIESFLNGHDPFEHIVNIECGYDDDMVSIIYNKDGRKLVKKDEFRPFVWAKNSVCIRMFDGNRTKLKQMMRICGINVKKLKTSLNSENSNLDKRIDNGYKYIFYATKKMSYSDFMKFFMMAKTPIYSKKKKNDKNKDTNDDREFLAISPVEQYMIASGKRMFKGYDNYDELTRLCFDLETQGLNPKIHAIEQIGIRTNKGFEKIISIIGNTEEERRINEYLAIKEFVTILKDMKPDVIIGYNSENFDFDFLIVRLDVLGFQTMKELSLEVGFRYPIYKKNKETVLKLGGEVEYYRPTIIWGISVVDGLHAVRRAQAIDSNMKSANLKYVTKYSDLNKRNRVYVPGDKISEIWNITNKEYAFNDEDGNWYHIDEKHPLKEDTHKLVSGRYIVERYLLDDIWETDKVELRYNEPNFLICKLLPTTFQRACTMGTAGTWKLIMLAWSYEHDISVPSFSENKRFTGGLSRLLKVGYVDNIVKLDYNSLYPSIMLTWDIKNSLDISGAMLYFLNYILTQREKFKKLKKVAGKEAKRLKAILDNLPSDSKERIEIEDKLQAAKSQESSYDKKQLPFKVFGNSVFGSYGSPNVYPWGDLIGAEKTTCIGRQSLRLMISWFTNLGYIPIVGDSFTEDTPLFIKYDKTNFIDIKPIGELINENEIKIDELGREYDYSDKKYKVLCRSGWMKPSYIYRHKTNKDLYEVSDIENKWKINLTEDHSIFNEKKEKIKPSMIDDETIIESFKDDLRGFGKYPIQTTKELKLMAKMAANGSLNKIPIKVLNTSKENIKIFLDELFDYSVKHDIKIDLEHKSKVFISGINFLKRQIEK